jgi:hypothetical protein
MSRDKIRVPDTYIGQHTNYYQFTIFLKEFLLLLSIENLIFSHEIETINNTGNSF